MNPRRVTLIMSTFGIGGAERVMSIMANYWAAQGWTIHLLVLDGDGTPPFYPLHPSVAWRDLDLSHPLGGALLGIPRMLGRLRRLRQAIRETAPDAVISFNDVTNVITLLALLGASAPVIVGERNDPHQHPLAQPWRLLRPWIYRQAACVVAQTRQALDYFSRPIRQRGQVIPNPVMQPAVVEASPPPRTPREGLVVLGMGRLHQQKGFDLLLQAFARVSAKHPGCLLQIWGEGMERANLERQIIALGLDGRASLPGATRTAYATLRQADIFVLSSRYEGFPNVLCEALACGVPVISFDCQSGPSAIIRDGIDGFLVSPDDSEALAAALDRLLTDASARRRMAARAPEIIERFGIDVIMAQWTRLISQVADPPEESA